MHVTSYTKIAQIHNVIGYIKGEMEPGWFIIISVNSLIQLILYRSCVSAAVLF